nr:hypothetical protein [Dickeya dadantii]
MTTALSGTGAAWATRRHIGGRGVGRAGRRQISGARLLCALAAAWEINGRVILSQQPSPERFRQVYGVCQHQSLGAAVAFGLLSGCDAAGLETPSGWRRR